MRRKLKLASIVLTVVWISAVILIIAAGATWLVSVILKALGV